MPPTSMRWSRKRSSWWMALGADAVRSRPASPELDFPQRSRMSNTVSRRSFLGGLTAAVGCLTAEAPLVAQTPAVIRQPRPRLGLDEYDAAAKLAYNENPYGPSDAVMKAMITAF